VGVMATGFNSRKAAQVVAYLAGKSPYARLNILKAIKLVYLADRESLRQSGFPIIDDEHVSMPNGPVNSMVLRLARGEVEDASWSELIRDRENHELSVTEAGKSCDWDELSDAEIQFLDKVWLEFGDMDPFALRDWTHDPNNIPEWEDPNGSSSPIPVRRILQNLAVENADTHSQVIEDHRRINRLLANL
jgi:uncharacterized phage-associated protein